jgi:hypothetical protein
LEHEFDVDDGEGVDGSLEVGAKVLGLEEGFELMFVEGTGFFVVGGGLAVVGGGFFVEGGGVAVETGWDDPPFVFDSVSSMTIFEYQTELAKGFWTPFKGSRKIPTWKSLDSVLALFEGTTFDKGSPFLLHHNPIVFES